MPQEWKSQIVQDKGVLCGADETSEWLLPWWWSRYKERNSFPVTFCDFGMSEAMRTWCSQRGQVVSVTLDSEQISLRSHVDENLVVSWEKRYGWRLWSSRLNWFKKPFALLESCYEKAIWVDVDCEILGSLAPLFKRFEQSAQVALVRESYTEHLCAPCTHYNGGVIVFNHGAPILEKWAQESLTQNHLFAGDDHLLSHLIAQENLSLQELSEVYNWKAVRGLNLNAVIVQWIGKEGKEYIRNHGGLKPSLDDFYQSSRLFATT